MSRIARGLFAVMTRTLEKDGTVGHAVDFLTATTADDALRLAKGRFLRHNEGRLAGFAAYPEMFAARVPDDRIRDAADALEPKLSM